MKRIHSILATLILLLGVLTVHAQDIIVTVAPVQQVLPPQALLYVSQPGKYFNVSLTNNSKDEQFVYLGLQLEQTMPASGLSISTPAYRMPAFPIVIAPNTTRQLTPAEIKTLFNHIPPSEIAVPEGLFDNFTNGSFALLPEGTYNIRMTAYKWDPNYAGRNSQIDIPVPVVLSNPSSGTAIFDVCYKAQSPEFLTPVIGMGQENEVATVDYQNAQFTWREPIVACNTTQLSFRYDFKVYELLPGQLPTDVIGANGKSNPVVYQSVGLINPMCIIPQNIVSAKFFEDRTYVAQVTASQANTAANMLNYTLIENEGKSNMRLFKVQLNKKPEPEPEQPKQPEQPGKDDDDDDDDGDGGSVEVSGTKAEELTDSLYNFRNPQIEKPSWSGNIVRRCYMKEDIPVEWRKAWFLGGDGQRQDTVKIEYTAQLFKGDPNEGAIEAVKSEPIWELTTTETKDTLRWEKIEDKVQKYDYLVLRVTAKCLNEKSVCFVNDSVNIIDFALTERASKKYFQCSNTVEIENFQPTEQKADYYKGKTIAIGEYQMEINSIEALPKGKGAFKGRGHIEWTPLGHRVMIAVKFDSLAINTDDIVIGGIAYTYPEESQAGPSDYEVVQKLFSDWGIDNLIGDSGLPYASQLQGAADGVIKDLAKELNIAKYYGWVKKGEAIFDQLMRGEVDDLHLPLSIPKSINKSPVDMQIVDMKFAATYATMNVLGEFTMPKSNRLKNDILLLGAPRLCISPERMLPESGTVALLGDFTLVEPESQFEVTFKAPEDLMEPTNGCFVSWHGNEFELFDLDMDMKIPKLKKVDKATGEVTNDMPVLSIQTQIGAKGWDSWHALVTMDTFEAEKLPGWTFTAQGIVIDHDGYWDPEGLTFPEGYNRDHIEAVYDEEGVETGMGWMGLTIETVNMQFPKGFLKGDSRMEVGGYKMIIDGSGVTGKFGATDIGNWKADGWQLKINEIVCNIKQNDFSGSHFDGAFHLPLTGDNEMVNVRCDMYPQKDTQHEGAIDFVLKVQGDLDLNFDFWLAEATIDQQQSYFLLEAIYGDNGYDTEVELCMAGKMGIGGSAAGKYKDKINKYLGYLPMKPHVPDIHFNQMRLATSQRGKWKSKYEAKLQEDAQNAAESNKLEGELLKLTTNKEFKLSDRCYFEVGNWSLASFSKELGPFKFSLDDYGVNMKGKDVVLELKGKIGLIMKDSKNPLVSVGASFGLNAKVDIENFKIEFDESKGSHGITYNDLNLKIEAAGLSFDGTLKIVDEEKKKGYAGDIKINLPGNLFELDCTGGYFKYEEGQGNKAKKFSYGYFQAKASSKVGIPITPLTIKGIEAGVYFNCSRNYNKSKGEEGDPQPKEGVIGVIAGMTLGSSDGEIIKDAEFKCTAVYDKNANDGKGRLSTFMFNGSVSGVGGMIDSKISLVWFEDDTDKYLQLNVTVDGKADGALHDEINGLASQMAALNTELSAANIKKELIEYAQGAATGNGLNDKIGDDSHANDNTETKAHDNYSEKKKKGDKMGFTVSLDMRLTFREKGKDLQKCKWHVYLGEPDWDKRCKLTLIDVKTGIVDVKINATMYLCFGNELPNDGQLPPIPDEISQFLNGQQVEGMEGGDLTKANAARERAVKMTQQAVVGGVMLGASVAGYVNVRLGIFYGEMGVNAGFDVSIRKLASPKCPDTSDGKMGHNGWYGEGQLYAYLYATFGIDIDLGFWSKKFPVIDAAIGGVLRCGTPHPTYFLGDARVKLSLLGGLVKVNRRFSFECGTVCNVFYGNPLDNFELFGDCTLGSASSKEGWAKEAELVSPNIVNKPMYYTQAPLDAGFRVLDENTLHQLENDWTGSTEELEMQSKRTFIFRRTTSAYLYEFTRPIDTLLVKTFNGTTYRDRYRSTRYISTIPGYKSQKKLTTKDYSQTVHALDISSLNPDRYYCLVVSGNAKEIVKGVEVDPRKYHDEDNWKGDRWVNEPWSQKQIYYFRTGGNDMEELNDSTDLQQFVALAYPSVRGQLKPNQGNGVQEAYVSDIANPTIALTQDMRSYCYQKGTLKWRLYKSSSGSKSKYESSEKWTKVVEADNEFVQNGNCLNMIPKTSTWWSKAYYAAYNSGNYNQRLKLEIDYEIPHTSRTISIDTIGWQTVVVSNSSQAIAYSRELGRKVNVGDKINIPKLKRSLKLNTYYTKHNMASIRLKSRNGDWRTGVYESKAYHFTEYEEPYIGVKLKSIKYDHGFNDVGSSSYAAYRTDVDYANDKVVYNGKSYRLFDPYVFLSYLSNYFFIGGLPITNYSFETMQTSEGYSVPSAEALIYHEQGNVYNGNLNPSSNYNIRNGTKKIKEMSQYFQWTEFGATGHHYPLHSFSESDKQWCNKMVVSGQSERTPKVHASAKEWNRMIYALWDIALPYYIAEKASSMGGWVKTPNAYLGGKNTTSLQSWYFLICSDKNDKYIKQSLQQFNNTYRGIYMNASWGWREHGYSGPRYRESEIQIPMYQFPLVFGAQFPNNDSHKWKTLHKSVVGLSSNDRRHQEISRMMFCRLTNSGKGNGWNYGGKTYTKDSFQAGVGLNHITSIEFEQYRVNSFDMKTQTYDCYQMGNNGQPVEPIILNNPFKNWVNSYNIDNLKE